MNKYVIKKLFHIKLLEIIKCSGVKEKVEIHNRVLIK